VARRLLRIEAGDNRMGAEIDGAMGPRLLSLQRGRAAMNAESELAVTLSDDLFDHLSDEASRLGIPLQWLVASIVVDTMDEDDEPEAFLN